MTLDEDLVVRTKQAADKLAEAERQVQLSRADYHTLVRRLHLTGGSLREIGEALGLSHQRVQQVVEGAGGTWWRRVWRSREVKRDAVCTFCDRPPSEVAKLIAGPNVYICDGCAARAEALLGGGPQADAGGLSLSGPRSRARCSFCGKRPAAAGALVTTPAAGACAACLALCRQILDDRAG